MSFDNDDENQDKPPFGDNQVDHTEFDISIVDGGGKFQGRPFLTALVDAYSGHIIATNLTFESKESTD
jgi:hypothetical protein